MLVHFYAGKYIFWYKGTLKTQYGLVHKFARYKQFYKHMIILKNVNNCDITYKTDFHFFLNNTGFVGIKAVVSSSFSEDTPDDWKPTVWISHQLGWGTGQGHSRNSPSHPLMWGKKGQINPLEQNQKSQKPEWLGGKSTNDKTSSPGDILVTVIP